MFKKSTVSYLNLISKEMRYAFFLLFLLPLVSVADVHLNHDYSIANYGAKGDGKTINTRFIQAAINDAASHGGGVVSFPSGNYVSGTLVLKDFVILRIDVGAQLLGSLDIKDYPENIGAIQMIPNVSLGGPLIYAENVQHAGIEGKGIIDGRGTRKNFAPLPNSNLRPGLIRFRNCKFMSITDINLRNPARWTVHLRDSEDITIRGISINSQENRNNDGIDIDGSSRVSITGCNIETEDDAIVVKSYSGKKVTDILVSNCILSSYCYAFKIGTETLGDIENVAMSNCAIRDSHGIAIQSVDGADVSNVTISNITMRDCLAVFEIRLGARLRSYPHALVSKGPLKPGRIRNISISNLQATNVADSYDYICGIPGFPVEDVTLTDINVTYKGGGESFRMKTIIPENIDFYPKWSMFDSLPSYGFFIRHAKGITINNLKIGFTDPEFRSAIRTDDVTDLKLLNSTFKSQPDADPVLHFINTSNALIDNCKIDGTATNFLFVEGKDSKGITVRTTLPLNAKQLLQTDSSVTNGAVKKIEN